MKNNIIRYFLVLSVGVFAGYYSVVILSQQQTVSQNRREKQFQLRTEEYQPSCDELQNKNEPAVTTKGADHFFIITRKDDYIVYGLNTEENAPPVNFWWSADLKSGLEQACD